MKRTTTKGSKLFSLKSKGQRSHPFYTTAFRRGAHSSSGADGTFGRAHGLRYDVSGHFRHLRGERYARNPGGMYKVIGVRSHQRGLASNTSYPAVEESPRGAVLRRALSRSSH